jgi:cation diffusion facilitator CzcD-associated flavoprotein CzcO
MTAPQSASHRRKPRIAVLGAGAGGLCMAIRLLKCGFDDLTIFEKGNDVGGTWRDNVYPGSGCDVPSFFYCYSFAQKKDWTRAFAEQPEILDYFRDCARRFRVLPRIRFDTEIAAARFDEAKGVWHLSTTRGETAEFDIVVSALGQLNRPFIPEIPGAAQFKGHTFHSARWDQDYDLSGKRVAVIGNGASAIQFVPRVAPKVAHLDIFQRSANWLVPKVDRPFEGLERWALRHVPFLAWWYRTRLYWTFELRYWAFKPGTWMHGLWDKFGRAYLAKHLTDARLRETQTPDYEIGCKRILISNDYLPALTRDNVSVVTDAITAIAPDGVVTKDGALHKADAIVYATGFQSTQFLSPLEVTGRGAISLTETWKDGAEAYLGVTVSGFPNFFMIYGPNTNLGHNSIIFMIEQQVGYILNCVREISRRDLRLFDVKSAAQRRFNERLRKDMADTVWATGCRSWYKTAGGKVTNNWAGLTLEYWWRMRTPNFADYERIARAI